MKFIKTICTYVVVGAATAIGWKAVDTLSNPFKRAICKQKFKTIANKLKKSH